MDVGDLAVQFVTAVKELQPVFCGGVSFSEQKSFKSCVGIHKELWIRSKSDRSIKVHYHLGCNDLVADIKTRFRK